MWPEPMAVNETGGFVHVQAIIDRYYQSFIHLQRESSTTDTFIINLDSDLSKNQWGDFIYIFIYWFIFYFFLLFSPLSIT